MVQLYVCMRKKKIKKQKGICIFVWMMSVYSESMEEKTSDAMVDLNLPATKRSHMILPCWETFFTYHIFSIESFSYRNVKMARSIVSVTWERESDVLGKNQSILKWTYFSRELVRWRETEESTCEIDLFVLVRASKCWW